jgi:hypothetical protein
VFIRGGTSAAEIRRDDNAARRQLRVARTTRKVGADEATALQGGQEKNAFLAVADGNTAKLGFICVLLAPIVVSGVYLQAQLAGGLVNLLGVIPPTL